VADGRFPFSLIPRRSAFRSIVWTEVRKLDSEIGYILNAISAEFGATFVADQEEAGMFLAGELA
jgi:hypothetical protein